MALKFGILNRSAMPVQTKVNTAIKEIKLRMKNNILKGNRIHIG